MQTQTIDEMMNHLKEVAIRPEDESPFVLLQIQLDPPEEGKGPIGELRVSGYGHPAVQLLALEMYRQEILRMATETRAESRTKIAGT
jgi:hypothetical protein